MSLAAANGVFLHRRSHRIFGLTFSEIDDVKLHFVESAFSGQKSILLGLICYKNQRIFNDFIFQRLIDVEDEQILNLLFATGFI